MSAQPADDVNRRDFIYVFTGATAAVGVAAAAWPLIDQMNPSAATQALATTEFDISKIEPGQMARTMWQGKPIFVRRRTAAELEAVRAVDPASMKDPQADQARVKPGKDEWLVVVAVCTHLGCVPNPDGAGWLCACHGSVYDGSGRIVRGPAPTNLPVPPYEFVSDTRILIG